MEIPRLSVDTSPNEYRMCFGCGKDNPIGLKLKFQQDGKQVRAEFTPKEHHQGWPGYVHGGVLFCLLDEAVGYATMYTGNNAVTAKIQIRLKRMVQVGEPLVITASVKKNNKRLVETEASICLKDGTVIAEASSTQFVFSQRKEVPGSNA